METDSNKKKYSGRWYCDKIKQYQKESDRWMRQAREAFRDYAFKESYATDYNWRTASYQRFPLFWSNIKTLMPLLYSRTPIPLAKRRFDDSEEVGRIAVFVLERLARYLVDINPFDRVMRKIVMDYLVTGKGEGRVFYKAKFKKPDRIQVSPEMQVPEGVEILSDESGQYFFSEPEVDEESVFPAWVPYDGWGHNTGSREWSDVWFQYFDHYYDKEEFEEMFPGEVVPFNHSVAYNLRQDVSGEPPQNDETESGKFAHIVEFWNMREKKICWVCPDRPEKILREEEDIYDLRQFLPCPEPLLSTVSDENLQPIPDWIQYRNALYLLDYLQNRQYRLIRALRAKGVYDASRSEIGRLAREGDDADLIPVEMFSEMQEKGGINALIQYTDTGALATALLQVYDAIDRQKQYIYEITGISDVLRGQTDPNETLGAQNLKQMNAQTRLSDSQRDIARFARDLIELMCDLALAKFSDQTIWNVIGMQFQKPEEQALFGPALELLRHDSFRTFRIQLETDATIAVDSEAEKQSRIELLNSLSQFFQQTFQVASMEPKLLPAMAEAALYAIRGLRQSAAIEGAIESSFDAIINPPPEEQQQEPPPDPNVLLEQEKLRIKEAELQLKAQIEQMKLEMKGTELMAKAESEDLKLVLEEQRLRLEEQGQKLDMLKEMLKMKASKDIETEKVAVDVIKSAMPKVEQSPVGPVVKQ